MPKFQFDSGFWNESYSAYLLGNTDCIRSLTLVMANFVLGRRLRLDLHQASVVIGLTVR